MTEFDAFILIGGRSSRLGSDKAFVELGGKTLMSRAADVVREAFAEIRITIVAANSSQFAIRAIADDIPFIFDLYEGRGPLAGIHAALARASTPWIFVLACDYPFVTPDILALLECRVSDEFGAVVPEQADGRLQPLCSFYKAGNMRPVVEEMLARPRVLPPMHRIVEGLDPRIVGYDEYKHLPGADELFRNINTPADLESARKRD
jgi:molybdopterin-guanine dinucleotide biosynthesis protein A